MAKRATRTTESAPARDLRADVVAQARRMNALGINQGTSGNVCVRDGPAMLITPSATPYESMTAEQVARVALDPPHAWTGPLKPSTEWRMHLGLLLGRPADGAVVHTHAPCCTALSMLRRDIPPVHYMIALFGGDTVRCAAYAPFGTQELADAAIGAMRDRSACLLANHGMVVAAATLERAMWLAVELEALARQYLAALTAGAPVLLSAAEIADARAAFEGYGLREP